MSEAARTDDLDRVLAFSIPAKDVRGRFVRLGPLLDTVLAAHDYPTAIRHVLAEALVLTALLGSLLKDSGSQMTMQAQTDGGIIDLLVCDYREGELRGYVRHDPDRLSGYDTFPPMDASFGKGYLAITFDLATSGERYQGIVPLEGSSLSEACEHYFSQSEQLPTLIRAGVRWNGHHCTAGGLLVQHLPDGEEGRERLHTQLDHPNWEHVSALAMTTSHEELVDARLAPEDLIWRLFHDEPEIRVEWLGALSRGCRCTIEHYSDVLNKFPEAERVEMRGEDGLVTVDCAFCSRAFKISV